MYSPLFSTTKMAFSNTSCSNSDNFNHHLMNNSSNHMNNSNSSRDCLDSGDFTYLYEDNTDSLIIYQTENTPICFSNDSPLSSLSLECLPSANFNLNSHHIQSGELNSSGDSLQDYNMEGTPVCFSYNSPLSPLSLDFSEGEVSPTSLDFINKQINRTKTNKKNDYDITSMISNMSIDNRHSTRSSNDMLNSSRSESRFGRLCSDDVQSDGFTLIDFNTSNVFDQSNNMFSRDDQLTPAFMNNSQSIVNKSNNQSTNDAQNRPSSMSSAHQYEEDTDATDYEDGFDEYEDEEYLNKAVTYGRHPSKTSNRSCTNQSYINQINQTQPNQNSIKQTNNNRILNDSQHVSHNSQQQSIVRPETCQKTNYLCTFGREGSIRSDQPKFFDSQMITHPPPENLSYYKKSAKIDENNLDSRSQYTIDGEEQKRHESVAYGPVFPHLAQNVKPSFNKPAATSSSDRSQKKSFVVKGSMSQVKQQKQKDGWFRRMMK